MTDSMFCIELALSQTKRDGLEGFCQSSRAAGPDSVLWPENGQFSPDCYVFHQGANWATGLPRSGLERTVISSGKEGRPNRLAVGANLKNI
jgi:hypothetical protein